MRLLGTIAIALLLVGCVTGPTDFIVSSVKLVQFPDQRPPLNSKLEVEFTTSEDLERLTRAGTVLAARAYFCDRPDDYALISGVRIYGRGEESSQGSEDRSRSERRFKYLTHLNVARDAMIPSNPAETSFDLRTHAEDVCVYISGGDSTPFGFKSNVFIVDSGRIAAALKRTR